MYIIASFAFQTFFSFMITFQHWHLLPCQSYLLWKKDSIYLKTDKNPGVFSLLHNKSLLTYVRGCTYGLSTHTHIGRNGCLTSFLSTGWF